MEIKQNLCRGFRNWSLPVLLGVFLFASCKDDLQTSVHTGPGIRFSVADGASWNVTRSAGSPQEKTTPRESLLGVLPLQAGDGGGGLYLHALLSDNTGNAFRGGERVETRSAPVTDMATYGNFGVFAYLYTGAWDGSAAPDFMYNTEVRGQGGVWSPAVDYNWPGKGKKLRFFAYAPYNASGIVLPAPHEAGYPDFTYIVPDGIQDQKDLLVAASGEMAGDHNAMAPLTFRHALTAVRFVVGDDMLKGKVSKITLRGVYGKAVYDMDGDEWSDFDEKRDFSQELDNKQVNGQAGEEITPEAGTFMMIPQQLPEGAEIEVVFTDDMTGTERTLTASIAGTAWPGGKTVTYRISTSSISVVPTFTVTAPEDFEYTGGDGTYSVTSYASVSRPGDPTKTAPMAWKAEFVEEDGSGGYNVIARPDWLTSFTASGDGSVLPENFAAGVAGQQLVENPYDEVLQNANTVSGIYDLSTRGGTTAMNTANCYIINAPGTYSLPLVYGNAIKNGATNASAYTSAASGEYVLEQFVNHLDAAITDPYIYNNANCSPDNATLVWQDEQNLVTNVRLDGHTLLFDVPQASIKQGNAIVAVRDASNTILWSWHIWVTAYEPGLPPTVEKYYDPVAKPRDKVITNLQNRQYTFMGCAIGWCNSDISGYMARSVKVRFTQTSTNESQVITLLQAPHADAGFGNSTYFQFGRKDPMLGSIDNIANKACYSENNYEFDEGMGRVSIGESIRSPYIFCAIEDTYPHNWCNSRFYNLWNINETSDSPNDGSVIKTIYDPSPVGYCLPPAKVFTGFTSSGNEVNVASYGSKYNSPYTSASEFIANKGFVFYCNKMPGEGEYDPAGGVIFFPVSGNRNMLTGMLYPANKYFGFYRTAGNADFTRASILAFHSNLVNPYGINQLPTGFFVRPVKE